MAEDNNNVVVEILNRVKKQLVARDRTFHCAYDGAIIVDDNDFKKWRKSFIIHFGSFILDNLDKLKMIVIGSSGAPKFNSVYAMVAREHMPVDIVLSVWNIIRALHYAFKKDEEFVLPNQYEPFYDYQCEQLKDNVLFINVCLDTGFGNHTYAVCSILFINELLKVAKERNQRLAVMDFRLVCHKHGDNISGNFPEENKRRQNPNYSQTDELYTIRNPDGYHHYPLLCHPTNLEDSSTEFREIFREMSGEFPIIRKMYRPPNSEDW